MLFSDFRSLELQFVPPQSLVIFPFLSLPQLRTCFGSYSVKAIKDLENWEKHGEEKGFSVASTRNRLALNK